MAVFRFSKRAERDLLEIANYTLGTWGEEQTIRYVNELEGCCQRLADNPNLGRKCDDIRPGLRRMIQGRHVIFYRPRPEGILVSRVLHQRMLPKLHPMDD